MPQSSLGCECGKDLCIECFLKDFDNRKVALWCNEDGMSLWDNHAALNEHLVNKFKIDNDLETTEEVYEHPKFEEYLLANFYVGKKCPFCNQMCVWKLNQCPKSQKTPED